MNQLEKLAQYRDAILLAEVAAWLHDDFKHSDQQIHKYVNGAPSPSGRQDTADLVPDIELEFLGEKLKFAVVKNRKQNDFVDGYLNRCHYTAHIEKEDGNSQQTYPAFLSSPFGFEIFQIPPNLTTALRNRTLWGLITNLPTDRADFQNQLQRLFSQVGGDTRRSGNEITLWEWGHTVGALYKAALIGAYFQHEIGIAPTPAHDLRWRLLGVRTDALDYLTNVSRLPDLIARQSRLQIAINNVQTLLEEVYPLATEVYRDENGSLYVVPDLSTLLNLQGDGDQTLQTYIQQQFTTDGDIVPQITLDPTAWWGQDPNYDSQNPHAAYRHEIPPVGAMLSARARVQNDIAAISEVWQSERQEICPVCALRPCINGKVDYCQVCGERRRGRVVKWLQDHSKTIWLDEVADANGRLTLVTGTFDLTNWLDGSFVQTLLVQEPTVSNLPVTKTPSFARLRRIWQTTKTFWQETQCDIDKRLHDDTRRRLLIHPAPQPDLTQHQVYELDLLGATRMSVLWDGNHLISTDNLSYTAVQLGIKPEDRKTPADAALAVGAWLDENKQKRFQLISDDEKNRQFNIQIADVDYQDAAYATTIPILAEPRTFMALVPADRALDVIDAIKTKYEREMGKVRNRLPLHLSAVYFHRRTPLRAALDAGRRMLKRPSPTVNAALKAITLDNPAPDGWPQSATVTLQISDSQIAPTIPTVMGDGATQDVWYPYWQVAGKPSDRTRWFVGSDGEHWVHLCDLRAGDQVYFTPATFDFEWLDSSAQRFTIAYDPQTGQRRSHPRRPYLLDELATIQKAWQMIAGADDLTSSQIYALRDLVDTKRDSWRPTAEACARNGMFWRFCYDAVTNANWGQRPPKEKLQAVTDWVVSGLFTDVIQLQMGIMKHKPQREEQNHE